MKNWYASNSCWNVRLCSVKLARRACVLGPADATKVKISAETAHGNPTGRKAHGKLPAAGAAAAVAAAEAQRSLCVARS